MPVHGNRSIIGHQDGAIVPCRDNSVATTPKYVKIIDFKLFFRHYVFDKDTEGYKKKRVENYILVSIYLDLVSGYTSEEKRDPRYLKENIFRMSKSFGGYYKDIEVMRILKITKTTYFILKKEIKNSSGRF